MKKKDLLEKERNACYEENGLVNQQKLTELISAEEELDKNHSAKMKEIRDEMASNMDENTAKMTGNWMAMLADAELYGDDISDESKSLRDGFLLNLDDMPPESRDAFQKAVSPMLDEMKKAQPLLFAKADEIATGIIYRIRRAFDEHSPSPQNPFYFPIPHKGCGARPFGRGGQPAQTGGPDQQECAQEV